MRILEIFPVMRRGRCLHRPGGTQHVCIGFFGEVDGAQRADIGIGPYGVERCTRGRKIEKEQAVWLALLTALRLDCALNLVRAEASCADVNMARSTVNDRLDTLDVGLPCTVGSSVRMGDLNTERNALAANIALCHQLHLLAIWKFSF